MHSTKREISENDRLVGPAKGDMASAKGNLGKSLDIKKVRTLEMGIAIRLTAPETPHIDDRLDARQRGKLQIKISALGSA